MRKFFLCMLTLGVLFSGMRAAATEPGERQVKSGLSTMIASPRQSESRRVPIPPRRPAGVGEQLYQPALTAPKGYSAAQPFAASGLTLPDLRGVVMYNTGISSSSRYDEAGLHKILDGRTEFMYLTADASFGCVVAEGRLYTIIRDYNTNFQEVGRYCVVYDYETGNILDQFSLSRTDEQNLFIGMVTDPVTGTIYGIGPNHDGSGTQLSTVTFTTGGLTVSRIADLSGPAGWYALSIDAAGQLYGIGVDGKYDSSNIFEATSSALYKIDKSNASTQKVGNTGMVPYYQSSATIDTKTGKMYWNICPKDGSGNLVEVNLATGAATMLCSFEWKDEIMGLHVAPAAAADGAPAAPLNVTADFAKGALSGTLRFEVPTTTFDGTLATGRLTYTVYADGNKIEEGTTTYGVTVGVKYTAPKTGETEFMVVLSNQVGRSPKARLKVFIGHGLPEDTDPVLEYVDGKMRLSWEPITTTVDGGYIDPEGVRYNVYDKSGTKVGDMLTATTFEHPVAMPDILTEFYYEVEAVNGDAISARTRSNIVAIGSILPPYSNDFDGANPFSGFTMIDAD